MKSFVLIGGGDVGRGNTSYETDKIDRKVVELCGKEHPNFLFIGLASPFSDSYYDTMKKIYSNIGCNTQYLKKKNIINNRSIVEEKINNADIIYFCGGDSLKLINDLNNYEITPLLRKKDNVVLVGMSAGAIMLSRRGLSDSRMLAGEVNDYEFIDGLGFVDINITPHYSERKDNLKRIIDKEEVYGLDNNTALVITDKIDYIKSKKDSHIYYISKDKEEILY